MSSRSMDYQDCGYGLFDGCAWNDIRTEKQTNSRRRQTVKKPDPDSLISRFKRLFCFSQEEGQDLPLVQVGYELLRDDSSQ